MDDFRTLRQLIVGWLLLLVALIPMNAQNGNVLGQVIRLPKSKGNIYQLLGLVTERSGYLFIYDSKIIDNEQTTSIKGGDYTIQEAIYAITGNKNLAIRAIENHLLLYLPESPSAPKSASVTPDSIQTYFSIEGSLQDQYTHEPIAFGSVGIGEARYRHHHQPEWRVPIEITGLTPIIQGTFLSYRLSSPRDRWSGVNR